MDAVPWLAPMPTSTDAPNDSKRSSIASPARTAVPPLRMTSPVMEARPTFSLGSYMEPTRTSACASTSGKSWFSSRKKAMPLGSTNFSGWID